MSDNENGGNETGRNDGTDGDSGTLSPSRAYELSETQGLSYREIAGMYDTSKSTVQRRVKEHKKSADVGRDSVAPTDFERSQLESALEDKKQDEDEYECSECGKSMDYMEYDTCPNCGTALGWTEL